MPMPIIESQTTDERLARLKTIAEQHTQALNRLEDRAEEGVIRAIL